MTDRQPQALGIAAMKALSHPLRARLLNLLSQYGPSTATALGDRIGESSGSTSYHLRQLERHGLVTEDTSRGNARDRWWMRTAEPIRIGSPEIEATPAGLAATQLASLAFETAQDDLVRDWIVRAPEDIPPEWVSDSPSSSTYYIALTAAETAAMWAEIEPIIERYRALHPLATSRPGTGDGLERVFTQFRAFPILDRLGDGERSDRTDSADGDPRSARQGDTDTDATASDDEGPAS